MKTEVYQALALTFLAIALCCGTVGCAPAEAQVPKPDLPEELTVEDLRQTLELQANRIVFLEQQLAAQKTYMTNLEEDMEQLFAENGTFDNVLGNIPNNPRRLDTFGRVAQGKLNIENQTGAASEIYVNGTRWSAIRGESYIYIPVGKVAIEEGRFMGTSNPKIYPISEWKPGPNGMMEMNYTIYQ
jgi:hypothetical protein